MVTKDEIERSIKEAVYDTTPDLLDTLISELSLETRIDQASDTSQTDEDLVRIIDYRRQKRHRRLKRPKRLYSIAALCAAALALFIGVRMMNPKAPAVYAIVGIDVNPSIEISVDKDEKVISAEGLNAEGKDILADMNLEKTDLNVACNAILGSMLKEGYLSDISNSVLVSVQSEDGETGKEIEAGISNAINDYLENYRITASILGQYVEEDEALETFAGDHHISIGKALLIRKILATKGQKMTEEALLKLSTQELIMLAQERGANRETNIGEADKSGYISTEEATEAALSGFGIMRSKITGLNVELDCDDGVLVYEVEFVYADMEYEVDIDARTGEVVSYENEKEEGPDQDDDDRDDENQDDDDRDDDD